MPSTLTEPIGPRSPDDILAVVYRRTEHVRRRRRQQLGAAAAAMALGVAGLLSALPGDDEASRVRVVDKDTARTEETQGEPPTATTVAGSAEPAASGTATTTTTAAPTRGPQPNPNSTAQASAPTTVPSMPTTTTVPLPSGPSVKQLAERDDPANDSIPPAWYYDIVHGSMELDLRNDVVVFTTRYRTPSGSGARDARTLRSEFTYDNTIVTVGVTESDNELSDVTFNTTAACTGCVADFDESKGELTVTIPVDTMDRFLSEYAGPGASIEQGPVSALHLFTYAGVENVPADETEDPS